MTTDADAKIIDRALAYVERRLKVLYDPPPEEFPALMQSARRTEIRQLKHLVEILRGNREDS